MNTNELAEIIITKHPKMRNYYLIKYELYKILNLDFDLFLTEDILNYNNDYYTLSLSNDDNYSIYWSKSIKFEIESNSLIMDYNVIPYFYYINETRKGKFVLDINYEEMSILSITHNIVSKYKFTEKQINIIKYIISLLIFHNINYEQFLNIIQQAKIKYYE